MSSKIPESENLIDNFIDELWLEKGLSKNTLSAIDKIYRLLINGLGISVL